MHLIFERYIISNCEYSWFTFLQITKHPDADFVKNRKIRIKLTGDGTKIGKRLHVVNFAFTLLDEGEKAYSASGNHCVAIIKEPESYEALKPALEDIIKEVETTQSLCINKTTYSLEYYLGGDWKFLAMATGIDSASSEYACIWCKCPALERHITDEKWSITDIECGARSIGENIRIASSRQKQFNVSRQSLFPTIPLTRVVVDNLHMFLRVGDVLIDLLIGSLRVLDRVNQSLHVRSLDGLTHLKTFESQVKQLGISGYSFYIGKQSQKLKWRTLTGPEKLTLFTNFNVLSVFPDLPHSEEVQQLWKDLIIIHKLFSSKAEELTTEKIMEFETLSKAFVDNFIKIYPAKHVTPYMHCMMYHVSEFMQLHGSILMFTQQGLEKYNDLMTKDYFWATCHQNEQCLIQILQKQNRLEHLENLGAQRPNKHAITCSNCKQKGHCTIGGHAKPPVAIVVSPYFTAI